MPQEAPFATGWAIQCRNINVIKTLLSKGIFDPAADQDEVKDYVRMAAATVCAGTADCLLGHIKQQKGSSFEGFSKILDNMFGVIGISTVDCSSDVHRWVMHGREIDTAIRDFINTLESFGGCMGPVAAFHTACDRSIPLMRELVRRGVDVNALDEYKDMTPLAGAIVAASLNVGGYKGCGTVRTFSAWAPRRRVVTPLLGSPATMDTGEARHCWRSSLPQDLTTCSAMILPGLLH